MEKEKQTNNDWDLEGVAPEVQSQERAERPKYDECESCSA